MELYEAGSAALHRRPGQAPEKQDRRRGNVKVWKLLDYIVNNRVLRTQRTLPSPIAEIGADCREEGVLFDAQIISG